MNDITPKEQDTTPISSPPQNSSIPRQKPVTGEPKRIQYIENIMIGVVIVLFIGFASMFVGTVTVLIESWNNKAATYQDLEDKIDILIGGLNSKPTSGTSTLPQEPKR